MGSGLKRTESNPSLIPDAIPLRRVFHETFFDDSTKTISVTFVLVFFERIGVQRWWLFLKNHHQNLENEETEWLRRGSFVHSFVPSSVCWFVAWLVCLFF